MGSDTSAFLLSPLLIAKERGPAQNSLLRFIQHVAFDTFGTFLPRSRLLRPDKNLLAAPSS